MRAGRLDTLVDVLEPARSVGASGEVLLDFSAATVAARIWCEVQPLAGREYVQSGAMLAAGTVRLRTRGPNAAHLELDRRLRYTDRNGAEHTLEINEVADVGGRGRELEIRCTENR